MRPILIGTLLILSFNGVGQSNSLEKFQAYMDAWKHHDYTAPEFKAFLNDTIYIWHDSKEGPGIQSVFNPFSNWRQWGVAMNGVFEFDSVRYVESDRKITTKFRETTDFLEVIDMPEGFEAIIHFWLDDQNKVVEILYDWSDRNPDFKTQMKPLVAWAKIHYPDEIEDLYLKNGFEPSWINAIRWRRLTDAYLGR